MPAATRRRLSPAILSLCLCAYAGLPWQAVSAESAAATAQNSSVGGDFTLTDYNGKPYSLKSDRGKVVLMFFGYTSCPDVCPTTLQTVTTVMKKLGDRARDVQPLFVSVDPKRDTPDHLKAYVHYFDPSILAVTGSQSQLRDVTGRYGTFYRYTGDTASNDYVVDHGSSLYVIDPGGQLSNIIPYGTPVDNIAAVISRLVSGPHT